MSVHPFLTEESLSGRKSKFANSLDHCFTISLFSGCCLALPFTVPAVSSPLLITDMLISHTELLLCGGVSDPLFKFSAVFQPSLTSSRPFNTLHFYASVHRCRRFSSGILGLLCYRTLLHNRDSGPTLICRH